ncbi:response regulator [Fertoebacter nigrum]|uniref:Response regulator n=1 Tax=Fertoeibacter niger TaxID=2656921 RepID=A0A8X8H420_9RHOB|nr:response regulator [Fertoeibacter niger]NUB45917.1 response regulator [Fertoeibacter niger]
MGIDPHLVGIVDDDSSVRIAIGSLLRSLGYGTVLFASAEEFLAAETEALDCLLCDINMPGMTGWELVAWMKDRGRVLPTIMITAFDEGGANGTAISGIRVFKKPFAADQMAEAIRLAIAKRD